MAEAAAKRQRPAPVGGGVVQARATEFECPPHHLGDAIIECTDTYVVFDRAKLLARSARRARPLMACGVVDVGFPVRGRDYAAYDYDER